MAWWQKLFHHQQESPADDNGDQLVTNLVTAILHHHRLLGEILLQLPRVYDPATSGAVGIAWQGNQLVLKINSQELVKLRIDDAQILLEHEALHVIWRHPLRYAAYPHQGLVQLATDVAVNQYLPAAPAGTVTLGQLERLLRQRLPEKQDSQDYLAVLEKLSPEERDRLHRAGIKLNGNHKGKKAAPGKNTPTTDTHDGWYHHGNSVTVNQQVRIGKIRQLLQKAWSQTPQRDRGLLPGEIQQQLNMHPTKVATPLWQEVLRRQLGSVVAGKQESHARFNRRQPLRMDLPGQVSHLVPDLQIFVDNSGSVPDKELARAIDAINGMVKQFRLSATVYTFDAHVNSPGQKLRPGVKVKRERHGGGGTSFQSVFDFLCHQRIAKRAVVIIITDGWGETTIRNHHYQNVYWLLTTERGQLSVPSRANHVFELKERPNNG